MVQIWILGYKSLSLRKFINFLEARSFLRLIRRNLRRWSRKKNKNLKNFSERRNPTNGNVDYYMRA